MPKRELTGGDSGGRGRGTNNPAAPKSERRTNGSYGAGTADYRRGATGNQQSTSGFPSPKNQHREGAAIGNIIKKRGDARRFPAQQQDQGKSSELVRPAAVSSHNNDREREGSCGSEMSSQRQSGAVGISRSRSGPSESGCPVCCGPLHIYAIAPCDHHVCYVCSTRMRVLCNELYCPICRQHTDMVAFVSHHIEPYSTLPLSSWPCDKKWGVTFESYDVRSKFNELLSHRCGLCSESRHPTDRTFSALKDHMRKEHDKYYCDICVKHLMLFSAERKAYNRKELARHRRVGDENDHSFKGHPLCEFCDQRFLDNDELFKHLRREHYFCHFCDTDGKHMYFR